jgi:cell division protein FtsL
MSAIDRPAARSSTAATDRRLGHDWSGRRTLLLAFLALAVLGLLQVNQAGDATSTGYAIRRLELERDEWASQVRRLEAEVAALTALERVERVATNRLGLKPAVERIYLDVPVPPPDQHLVPRRYLAPEEEELPAAEAGNSWWQSLFKLLPFY